MKILNNCIQSPFCYIRFSVRDNSLCLVVLLLPQLIMLALTGSFQSLFVVAASVSAVVLSELIENRIKKRWTLNDGTAVVEGILIGMLLPQSYPLWLVFTLVFCAMYVTKHFFGGIAACWANPSMVTVAVLFFFGSAFFPGFMTGGEAGISDNLCSLFFQSGATEPLVQEASVNFFLNNTLLKFAGITLPDGFVTLFWDTGSVIPAFRFNLLTLVSSLIYISLKMTNSLVVTLCLGVYAVLVRLFSLFPSTGLVGSGDMLFALLTGGTLFIVFFVLPWYGTLPSSMTGKIVYGVLAGITLFLFNGYGTSPIGGVFTILVLNTLSPVIQIIEDSVYSAAGSHNLEGRGV